MIDMTNSELAVNGGSKVRAEPMPYRRLFGAEELDIVRRVFEESWQAGVDFSFQGKFEELYTSRFCEFQGGGFADAVCSGTAAVYLALKALDIPTGSDVIVSPITDPGCIAPIVLLGYKVRVADACPDSWSIGPSEFERAQTPNTRAAILTHTGGYPFDIQPILEIARSKGIRVVEDCSQAHGALYRGKRVGRFGDVAAFSTMFSKNHATGGCGGVVYTEDEEIYWRLRALADRGKPFHRPDFNPKDPSQFLFPALNFNLDELSCAIGYSTLARLPDTIEKRNAIAAKIDAALERSAVVSPCIRLEGCTPSPFFHTVAVDSGGLTVSKVEFAEAVGAEGIAINPDYRYIASEWPWLKPYLTGEADTPNAVRFRDRSFNILFNERYTDGEVRDIVDAIIKVESHLAKRVSRAV